MDRNLVERYANIQQLEDFFSIKLPEHLANEYEKRQIYLNVNQQQMMQTIDFTPPFLRIDKMAIFDTIKDSWLQSKSLGMGVITTKDTSGHYNDTIFLAMCGWLMASSASVHLGFLFPLKTPQVIEANKVRPILKGSNSSIVWKPSAKGTPFWVETVVLKKKLQLVAVVTRITFGNILYGTIEELKLILTDKKSIWSAKEIPL